MHTINDWRLCVVTGAEIGFTGSGITPRIFDCPAGVYWHAGKLLRDFANDLPATDTDAVLIIDRLPVGMWDEQHNYHPEFSAEGDADTARVWRGRRYAAFLAQAMESGFQPLSTEAGADWSGWVTMRAGEHGTRINVGVLEYLKPGRTPLFDLAAKAETIIDRMTAYQAATGVLFRMTAGVSGCAAIRADRKTRATEKLYTQLQTGDVKAPDAAPVEPHWRWDDAPKTVHGAGVCVWQRELFPSERHGQVITFDIRGQYLASMGSAAQGWGKPRRMIQPTFDASRAGFWQVGGKALLAMDGPPIVRDIDESGYTWVTTPVLEYLAGAGIKPYIYDSWTSPTASQILRPWAAKLKSNLAWAETSAPELLPALKRTYAEANGMFNVPGGSIFRPDWYHTHVDLGMINVRRKLDKAKADFGIWPVKIYFDSVSYPVADDEEITQLETALGVKPVTPATYPRGGFGKFRRTGLVSVAEWEAKAINNG